MREKHPSKMCQAHQKRVVITACFVADCDHNLLCIECLKGHDPAHFDTMMSFEDIDLEERFFPDLHAQRNDLVQEFVDLFHAQENGIKTVKERIVRAFEKIAARLGQKKDQIVALLPTIYQLKREANQAGGPQGEGEGQADPTLSQKMEGRMRELQEIKIDEPLFFDSLAGAIEFKKKEGDSREMLADFVEGTRDKLVEAERIDIFETRCLEVVDGIHIADFRKGGLFEFEKRTGESVPLEENKGNQAEGEEGPREPAKLPPAKPENQQNLADWERERRDMQTQIEALQAQIAEVRVNKEELTATLNQKVEELAQKAAQIQELTAQMVAAPNQPNLAEITAARDALQQQVAHLTTEKIALQTTVTALTTEKTNLQTQLEQAQARATQLTNEKTALQNNVTALTTDKTNIQSQLTQSQARVTQLTNEKTAVQQQVTALTNEKTNLQTQLNQSQARVNQLTTEKTNIQNSVNTLTTSQTNLQTQVNNLTSQVTSLNNDKNSLNSTISSLNSQLSGQRFGNCGAVGTNGSATVWMCKGRAKGCGSAGGSVWGTTQYTNDSNRCRAALHCGTIGQNGGLFFVDSSGGLGSYTGSTRNGETSNNYGSWGGTITFRQICTFS